MGLRARELVLLLWLAGCSRTAQAGCSAGAIPCGGGGSRCMPSSYMCDGGGDCYSRWDEARCGCGRGKFLCDNICRYANHTCDGVRDCQDGWDEEGCSGCNRDAVMCDVGCLREELTCDGVKNCTNGADENNCYSCKPGTFLCDNRCLKMEFKCDGGHHCADHRDEINCTACNGGALYCDGKCLKAELRCDGIEHCGDGSDEKSCSTCNGGAILCSRNRCLSPGHLCDDVSPCVNGSGDCGNGTDSPNSNFTGCPDKSRCNGVYGDCDSRDDEVACTAEMCGFPAYSHTFCDGRCIAASRWCDGTRDCHDLRDEKDCPIDLSEIVSLLKCFGVLLALVAAVVVGKVLWKSLTCFSQRRRRHMHEVQGSMLVDMQDTGT